MPGSPRVVAAPWPCTRGSSSCGNNCPTQGLLPSSRGRSELGFYFTPPLACRGKEGQDGGRAGRRNNFFGEEVHVSGLAPEGTTLHTPTGTGCWVLSGQAKLPAALLAIRQAPEAMPRKNPVRGQDWEAKIRWERDWQ